MATLPTGESRAKGEARPRRPATYPSARTPGGNGREPLARREPPVSAARAAPGRRAYATPMDNRRCRVYNRRGMGVTNAPCASGPGRCRPSRGRPVAPCPRPPWPASDAGAVPGGGPAGPALRGRPPPSRPTLPIACRPPRTRRPRGADPQPTLPDAGRHEVSGIIYLTQASQGASMVPCETPASNVAGQPRGRGVGGCDVRAGCGVCCSTPSEWS